MASHSFLNDIGIFNKRQTYQVNDGVRKQFKPQQKPFSCLSKSNHSIEFDSNMMDLPETKPKRTSLPKKHNQKTRHRDQKEPYKKKSHIHPCERLLSLMVANEQEKKTRMLSIKKYRGDILEFLTQFSGVLAGTSIVVFFSVAFKKTPFCAKRCFEIGVSLSLVLISWTVTQLRDAIGKAATRKGIKEEQVISRVYTRLKEFYFRVVIFLVLISLRFC